MSWIRIAVAGLAFCFAASSASAQGRGPSMLEGITLTASQQQKVDSVQAAYRAERQKAMPNGARPDSATRAKFRKMIDQQNAEIRELLTADQQKVFDTNVEAAKKRREAMRPTPRS